MAEQHGDKSQEPTPLRRQKAREMGQVAKSQDLGSAVVLLAGLATLLMLGGGLIAFLLAYAEHQLSGAWISDDLDYQASDVVAEYHQTLFALAPHVLPILGLLLAAAVAAGVLQTGFLFLPEKLAPDVGRLSPLGGLKRLFSVTSVARVVFGLLKIAVVAAVAGVSLYGQRDAILGMTGMEVPEIGRFLLEILLWTSIKIGMALLMLAVLDYGFQRWKHEQDLKMTPQEVREEMKHLEGNREVAARRKQVQRQLALSRSCGAAAKADLVIADAAQSAVAIRYESATMAAPIVVAKGTGPLAQRIRQFARQRGIFVAENKPLAEALCREVDVEEPIPADRYAAVAELLADGSRLPGGEVANARS